MRVKDDRRTPAMGLLRHNPLVRKCALFALLICGVILALNIKGAAKVPPIDVSMTCSILDTNQCLVTITMVNNSRRDLVLEPEDLPWQIFTGNRMILAAVARGPMGIEPIGRRIWMITDPPVSFPTTLKRGEKKSMLVSLSTYYDDLLEVLRERDVTVFWEYRPPTLDGIEPAPICGSLHLRYPAREAQSVEKGVRMEPKRAFRRS